MRLTEVSLYEIPSMKDGQVPKVVQVLRTGSFNHPRYGAFEITTQTLAEMKANFDKKIRGIDTAFDYFHKSDEEASGWARSLELRENGTELWAEVDWTPTALQKLAERAVRYFSPDFAFQWQDPETGVVYNNVLFGGGLTNRPFVKEMAAIVADEHKGDTMTELEKTQKSLKDAEAKVLKLSEEKTAMEKQMADMAPKVAAGDKAAELEAKIAELQAELAKVKQEKEVMAAEKMKADEAKALAEKETAFNLLLTEGKACAAQKDAFIKGDMNEFIKLAQPLNLKGTGTTETPSEGETDHKAIIKLAEEIQKKDSSLSRGDAISLALKQTKK